MPDIDTVRGWQGRTLVDRDGDRIGSIDAIYLDDRTGQPEWALVNTGLFGTKSSFVPLAQAIQTDNDVLVPYDKQLVKDAPRVDPDGHLSEAEERQLWRHYGLDYDRTDQEADATGRGTVGRDTSGPTTDDAMTRSEEELRVGTTQRRAGPGPAAQVRHHRAGPADRPAAAGEGRVWSASRSPTPTLMPPPPARTSPRTSTR